MYTSNLKVVTKLPKLISTISDIPEEVKEIITPYGNKYSIYNFGYQFSNPLILPFNVTIYAIVYGNISLSSTTVNSNTFTIKSETTNKLTITGNGTVLLWYRYGTIDPGTFDVVMSYAIENNDYILIDALLHSLSICEAISFILQNPEVQEVFKKGLDWQLNKLGFNELLAYLNGGKYDVRKLALFLTIASYVFPCVFTYTNIPQFSGQVLQVYLQYLNYLQEFGQVITSEITELSEQIEVQQTEIAILFSDYTLLSSEIAQCCPSLLGAIEQTVNDLLKSIDNIGGVLTNTVLGVIRNLIILTGVISQIAKSLGTSGLEIGSILSQLVINLWTLSSEVVGDVSELLGGLVSNVIADLSNVVSGISEILTGVFNTTSEIVSDVDTTLDSLLSIVSEILPIININIQVSEYSSESSESSESESSESSSSSGGLGGLL